MGTPVVNVSNFLSAVQSRLKNSVVGYSFVIGGAAIPAKKFSAGSARTAANGQSFPFESSTPSGVGSVSKFITAIAAVQLLDRPDAGGVEGWNILNATLDSPMYKGLPTYWDLRSDIQAITYRDLLTHTSGLGYGFSVGGPISRAYMRLPFGQGPDAWLAALAGLPLVHQPGERLTYGHSSDVVGVLASRVEGKPFHQVLDERILQPLGMIDTGFHVTPQGRRRAVSQLWHRPTSQKMASRLCPAPARRLSSELTSRRFFGSEIASR